MFITTMFSSLDLIYSSLQTGFLAFSVFLSLNIMKTLLQGSQMSLFWSQLTPECHTHDKDDCTAGDGEDCIDDGGDDCVDDGGDDTDCGSDTIKILTIVLQVPRILPISSQIDSMTMESLVDKLVNPNDIITNMLFTSSKFSSLNNEVQACVTAVMENYCQYHWYSVVNVQECLYSGGSISSSLKPVVTITDMYYTGSEKLKCEGTIFLDLRKKLTDTLCNKVWKGEIHVTTTEGKIVPHSASTNKFSHTRAMWENRAKVERPVGRHF